MTSYRPHPSQTLPRLVRQQSVIFDIDGVLIDSEPLVREAYRRVNVEMPEDAWGQPWHVWLPKIVEPEYIDRVRAQKAAAYFVILQENLVAHTLPAAFLARDLIAEGHPIRFITGASVAAAEYILEMISIPPNHAIGYELNTEERIRRLTMWQTLQGFNSIYVDDRVEGETVADRSGTKFLHYIGQAQKDLREELEALWIRSF